MFSFRLSPRYIPKVPQIYTTTMTISIQLTTAPPANKIKRNLFGALDHDLLAQDLNDMWKDTIDRQINKWNFDFAQLCPLQGRYEWSNEGDDSQHQMPEFYKLTARIKSAGLKPSPKQLKKNASASSSRSPSLTPSSSTSSLSESPVKFDMILRGGKSKTPNASPMRSSPKRQRCSRRGNQDKHSPSKATGLIITYSENRKDTLRSAVMSGDCSTASATRQIFKQQSLLDMLKQRKRRPSPTDDFKPTAKPLSQIQSTPTKSTAKTPIAT